MTGKKLLSVAEIARELDIPESTVHYWKNRFAQHLPSVGKGRQKRFKPEAVEVFSTISRMLKEGHTARDVMDSLSQSYPMQADALAETPDSDSPVQQYGMETAVKMAAAMGAEMARSISEGIRTALAAPEQAALPEDFTKATEQIAANAAEVQLLRDENAQLKEKLSIMEAEMVRLRKDRREMEKYLLDKIKSVTS
ncbi:helix-turn-helix domain-containing protein [Desulfovibrio oxyclinae]|jgi:DNA-binding transcriptional MerR regulator|uniref:helix-turn-helix domain-containing protein n=1 Tax=Desulfovibrio oxyclinae TaxID=63560 RepID=UPI00036A3184|nr:helix-turn-helix domain-containing protein [Desulfovibrio oxyclinae]